MLVEGQCVVLGQDVVWCILGKYVVVFLLDGFVMFVVVDYCYFVVKVCYGFIVSGYGLQVVIGIYMEEQGGDIGGGCCGVCGQGDCQQQVVEYGCVVWYGDIFF